MNDSKGSSIVPTLRATLLLACGLLPLFFFFRASSPFMEPAEFYGVATSFALALNSGMIAAGVILLFRHKQIPHVALHALGSGAILLSLMLFALISYFAKGALVFALASGVIAGLGVVWLLAALINLFKQEFHRSFIGIAGAFFLASSAWYGLMYTGNHVLVLVSIGVATIIALMGGIRSLGHIEEQEPLLASSLLVVDTTERSVWRSYGAGLFGMVFNFFTMGLTFWPRSAGVMDAPYNINFKPGAYFMVLLLLLAVWEIHRRYGNPSEDEDVADQTALVMLPLATAIVLVSPFIDAVFVHAPLLTINLLPYAGIAALHILSIVLSIRISLLTKRSIVFMWAILMAGSGAAMALGILLYKLLGQEAQMVSLCVLTLYLVGMLISTIRRLHRLQSARQSVQFSIERACGRIVERYNLSPREAEILGYIAHGRGAKYVSDKLCISSETVRTHIKRIYEKCDVHTKEELLDLVESLT